MKRRFGDKKKSVNQHIEEKYVENKTLYIMYKKEKC